jgi:hypothetical protein
MAGSVVINITLGDLTFCHCYPERTVQYWPLANSLQFLPPLLEPERAK